MNFHFQFDRTPVHIAAERGHTHVVDLLLDKFKTGLSARTKDGSTLMHIASTFGHPETAMAFLKKGVPLYMPNKVNMVLIQNEITPKSKALTMVEGYCKKKKC